MDHLLECPFNRSHQIIPHRMPAHLVKCKKNYTGPPLDACPYNAMHLLPKEKMRFHLHECPDYNIVAVQNITNGR